MNTIYLQKLWDSERCQTHNHPLIYPRTSCPYNSYNKTNKMHQFLKFMFGIKLYMLRTVTLPIIRSLALYTQQWYMSYRFCWLLASGIRLELVSSQQNLYDIYHCCVYSAKTPDDGQSNCLKHVEFYSKNKSEKLADLVSYIIRIYHAARSSECQNVYTS